MVAHYHLVCDNYSVVEWMAVAHNSDHMAVAMDMIQAEEQSVSGVVDVDMADSLKQFIRQKLITQTNLEQKFELTHIVRRIRRIPSWWLIIWRLRM